MQNSRVYFIQVINQKCVSVCTCIVSETISDKFQELFRTFWSVRKFLLQVPKGFLKFCIFPDSKTPGPQHHCAIRYLCVLVSWVTVFLDNVMSSVWHQDIIQPTVFYIKHTKVNILQTLNWCIFWNERFHISLTLLMDSFVLFRHGRSQTTFISESDAQEHFYSRHGGLWNKNLWERFRQ